MNSSENNKINFSLYSKSAEYAIQAMIYLSEHPSDKPIMISQIADAYNIPYQFLAKIMQSLVKHRLIVAKRGRSGGVNLGREPKEIYLSEIITVVDGPAPKDEICVIGLDLCSDDAPCPLHHQWGPIRSAIRGMLSEENLEELARRITEKRKAMKK